MGEAETGMNGAPRPQWLALAAISSLVMVAAFVAVLVTTIPVPPNVYILGLLAYPVVGGLVVARQPANLVGRLLVLVGAWDAVGAGATSYLWIHLEVGPLPLADAAAWLALWAYWPALPLTAAVVAVFPSGRIASPWSRAPLVVGAAATFLLTVILMFLPVPVNVIFFGEGIVNPLGLEWLEPLNPIDMALPILAAAVLGLVGVDLVVRWRRAEGVERLQMRWVGLGLVVVAILAVVGGVVEVAELAGQSEVLILLWLALGVMPAAIGLAVMRYRLYEIDRLISRTVTYAVVAGLLAAVFAALAIGLPQLVGVSGESPVLVAAATLAAAGLFNPLRRRVQAAVDRRFNRARSDARQEMEHLADRLRGEVEMDDLRGEVLELVSRSLQPASASLWFRRPGSES